MKVNREWLDTRTGGRSSRRLATRSSGLGRSGRRFRPWCDVGEGQCEPRVLLSLSEFRVNEVTLNNQDEARVAVNAVTGDFVVVWESYGQDGWADGVYARRYSVSGVPLGGEFQVHTYTTNAQRNASVAMNAAGDFVVVWQSYSQDGSGYGVYAQRFNASGNPVGSEFQVNTYTTSFQVNPHVAMNAAGDFVVAWQSYSQDGWGYGVYAQRFDASGNPVGSEFQVHTYTTSNQRNASVAMNAAGDFVVAWESFYQDGSSYGVYAQRFDASGNPVGSEFQVHTYTTSNQRNPHVAMNAAGDFVVAWESDSQDSSGYGVYLARYASSTLPSLLDVMAVHTLDDQLIPLNASLDRDDVSHLVVTFSRQPDSAASNVANWSLSRNGQLQIGAITGVSVSLDPLRNRYVATLSLSGALTPGLYSLEAKPIIRDLNNRGLDGDTNGQAGGAFRHSFRVMSTGKEGDEFQVHTTTTFNQRNAHVAMNPVTGDFVVVWQSFGQDGLANGVYAQRFDASGNPMGGEFQVNTYTTSNQSDPHVAMNAAGDFVVVWESDSQDGWGYGVYAQRYRPLVAGEFAQVTDVRVNWGSSGNASILALGAASVPVANLNAVEVRFSTDVNVSISDLSLTRQLGGPVTITGFTYDPVTFTARWSFASLGNVADTFTLSLPATLTTNPGGYPVFATPYQYEFSVVTGDFNGDGVVTIADAQFQRQYLGQNPLLATAAQFYRAFANINGDTDIDTSDFNLIRARIGFKRPGL